MSRYTIPVCTCFITAALCALLPFVARAQRPQWEHYYVAPVAFDTLTLSGSVGEFRGNHFHGGLDFRVGGVVGAPVRAVADGYISRITVNPDGYGNGLYITHPNGTVSVYGHLDSYIQPVADYVKEAQYRTQSFVVDLQPDPQQFPVTQGRTVARAGNTGDSAGPHLHFEIRYEDTLSYKAQMITNLLECKLFPFTDKMPPEFRRIQFYGYRTDPQGFVQTPLITEIPVSKNKVTLSMPDTFYVAVDAIDRMNGTYAKLGIQRWEVTYDGQLVYAFDNTDYPQEKSRHINALIQYSQYNAHRRQLLKTWVEPGFALQAAVTAPSQGLMAVTDSLPHTLVLTLWDAYRNRASRTYTIKRSQRLPALVTEPVAQPVADSVVAEEYYQTFYWDRDNVFAARDIKITLPSGGLYRNIPFCATRLASFQWQLFDDDVPLQLPMELQINMPASIPDSLYGKTVLLRQNLTQKDSWQYAGGEVKDSVLTAQTLSFGRFKIGADTLAPTVKASIANGADIRGRRAITFTIRDDCSGIASYSGTIDDQWVLVTYEQKNRRLSCVLDPKVVQKGKKHRMVLEVADGKQNVTVCNLSFTW